MRNANVPTTIPTGDEILIIEDDTDIVGLLTHELTRHHYRVRVALDGQRGVAEAQKQPPGLIILDLMLPELDGWAVCRLLRSDQRTKAVPVLILTALGQEADRVRGLESGADDYLAKPFSLKELVARVRALLRRPWMKTEDMTTTHLQIDPLIIDIEHHEVRVAGRLLQLTPTEFALLNYLAQHPGRVFTGDQLITALWEENRFVEEHSLDLHIRFLRQKLEELDPTLPKILWYTFGYTLQLRKEEK